MPNLYLSILGMLGSAMFLPLLIAVAILLLSGKRMDKATGWLTFAGFAGSFALSVAATLSWLSQTGQVAQPMSFKLAWIKLSATGGDAIYLGAYADSLTLAMFCMVTGIATLVALYSIGYMAGDKRYSRYFAYLSFFVFSMLGLVIANTFVQVLVFWELVGIASYLLIGFWFEKQGPQVASLKAVLMNKVGDVGLFIGIGIVFHQLWRVTQLPEEVLRQSGLPAELLQSKHDLFLPLAGNGSLLSYVPKLLELGFISPGMMTAAGIFLFVGAMGKSAQFPLHTWLPDAMEGPTPVSSIIHSATMVGAGVYLTARLSPILTPAAHLFIIIIGITTMLIAGLMALVNQDIKRVLAYSTVSQLGLMMLGIGTGSFTFAIFHLITHAFFKCCLFQCAGSVITATHHVQDMRRMGGLFKKMPITGVCFLISSLALAGATLPGLHWGLSGYYSKHGIIEGAGSYAHLLGEHGETWGQLIMLAPVLASYLTAFYMARAFALVFLGKPRDQEAAGHAHEVPWTMAVPQVLLASMCFLSVPAALPFLKMVSTADPMGAQAAGHTGPSAIAGLELWGLGWAVAFGLGIAIYVQGYKISRNIRDLPVVFAFSLILERKFFLDTLYDRLMVGIVRWMGRVSAVLDQSILGFNFVSTPVLRLSGLMRTTQAGNPRVSIGIALSLVALVIVVAGAIVALCGN
jgi:NADH-quinone oxidoreductase subunit L